MEIVIAVNIIALIFSILESTGILKKGLLFSFIIILVFLVLRYRFGNDYLMYELFFDSLDSDNVGIGDLGSDFEEHFEIGWQVLNKFFSLLNLDFSALIAFISIVNVSVVYKFIKTYVPVEYYWLAVFIYTFNVDFMLIHLSAIRQLIAILLMLISIQYFFDKKYYIFVALVLLGTLFHTSAFIIFLLVPLFLFNKEIGKGKIILFIGLFFSLFFVSSQLGDVIDVITKVYLDRYETYQEEGEEGEIKTGLGFLVTFIYLLFLLFGQKNLQDKQSRSLVNVSIFSIFLSVLAIKVMMIYRLNMYFMPFSIVTFPIIANVIEDYLMKRVFIVVILFMNLYNFSGFFYSEIYGEYYIEYKTIFEK